MNYDIASEKCGSSEWTAGKARLKTTGRCGTYYHVVAALPKQQLKKTRAYKADIFHAIDEDTARV